MDKCVPLVEAGAAAGSYAELAENCDVIITMLPNGPQVKSVMLGEDGAASRMKVGSTFIDMSSINPVDSKEIAAELEKYGVEMLDAPVSGGEPKAIDGTLSIMVGGDKEVFESVKDILLVMGGSAVYCGPIGAGNTTKLANQIVVACNIAAVAEAFTLAKKAGVDPELVYQAIRGGLAGSTVMDAKGPMMIADNFKPGFRIDLHIKDLNNAIETGHAVGSPLPLSAQVMEMFMTLRADGCGSDDHSALAKYYAKVSGTKISDK
jgi:2-hydroxy-3-oxopropionate reductase